MRGFEAQLWSKKVDMCGGKLVELITEEGLICNVYKAHGVLVHGVNAFLQVGHVYCTCVK
jgi:hypothetical protein